MKLWVSNLEQLREAYVMAAEDMADGKPHSVEFKPVRDTRNNAINSVFHIVVRQIRKHLFKSGMGYVEYEDEFTGAQVRMPLDDELVKDVVKSELGTRFVVMGVEIPQPTRMYEQAEMAHTLKRIDAWAAHDLNLVIKYKERVKAIEEKYKEPDDEK